MCVCVRGGSHAFLIHPVYIMSTSAARGDGCGGLVEHPIIKRSAKMKSTDLGRKKK